MSAGPINSLPLQPALIGRAPLGNEADPVKNLQLGQTLFGKVLRVYQDGSYLVDLNGREHVVDSALPLRQDEVFRGKIVGLGERVVLEKMVGTEAAAVSPNEAPTVQIDGLNKNLPNDIKAFINQHQSLFGAATWNALIRAANQTKQPQIVLSAAVYLQKLGLPFNTELATKFADYLSKDAKLKSLLPHDALHLQTNDSMQQSALQNNAAVQVLADYLKQKAEEALDHARDLLQQTKASGQFSEQGLRAVGQDTQEFSEHPFDQAVFQWLMNAQVGGAVSHRLIVLPLVLDGKLVELEMALFDQNESTDTDFDLKSKVVHLSLNTEHLGKISVTINAVKQNLRIHFSAEAETGLHMLSTHNQSLAKQLEKLDCQLDELSYMVNPASATHHEVTRPIMDMVVNTNSFSMLV